ncbi:hypothetical protein [Actinacidiphila acididurans]|uniref:Uncharacterized protein n=1 Tax=Actinacidiphila acididurans TaxID=2784346 RepID=A0ABS2U5V7_9ACTN|nr:hypothetical protein [Actinacidiphila acididurans]MBM9510571.1 hypothetical protein [Actinacidiphila acididurans]
MAGTMDEPHPTASPNPSPSPSPTPEEAPSGSVTEYLFFFLGLLPTLISAVRIYLIAHGDRSTMLELLRTLNVTALMLDTFIRFIGVIGMAVTAFLFLRLRRLPPTTIRPAWLRRIVSAHRRTALWLLAGTFTIFLSSAYEEEFFDADNKLSWTPDDLLRIYAWLLVIYVVRALAILTRRRYLAYRAERTEEPTEQAPASPARNPWLPWRGVATYTLLPVAVLMTWSLLKHTDDRMWLPSQVITIDHNPAAFTDQQIRRDADFPYLNGRDMDGHFSFVGYVLDDNGTSQTILSSNGVLVTVGEDAITSHEACQYEPTYDVRADTPFVDRLLNHDDRWHPAPTCEDLLRKVLAR